MGGKTAEFFPGSNRPTVSRGASLTLSISEWPKDAAVCSLSDTLETGTLPRRYFLSAKACKGILRRAEKRGKELPDALRIALEAVASGQTFPQGGAATLRDP
jgi:hypothetical protein